MGCGNQGDGSHRDSLVDDRDTVLFADILAGFYQVASIAADFIVNMVTGAVHAAADAVQQGNSHGNGTYVQVLIIDHGDGFQDITGVHHNSKPFLSRFRFCAWN